MFRPWLDTGYAVRAEFVFASGGKSRRVGAHRDGGRWVADELLGAGERARIPRGAVEDRYGNFNGERSDVVTG